MQTEERKNSRVVLTDRNKLEMDGVSSVVSYDDGEIVIDTVCGRAVISGSGLSVSKLDLDSGEVCFDGVFDEIVYVGTKEEGGKKGLFSGLFR